MRFVATDHLKSGNMLASDLEMSNRIMLRKGKSLTDSLIKKIDNLGFQGIYVDDELSKDIVIDNVISDGLKIETKKELQSLLFSVENNITSKIQKQIDNLNNLTVNIVDEVFQHRQVMINIIDLRTYDDYTYSHSLNVSILSVVLGASLGLRKQALTELAMGALLHDTGKMFIDKKILNKPDKLTDEEFEEIKRHSELGYNFICENMNVLNSSKLIALHHHEQFNGKGYPRGLVGEQIHLYGRIICVVDVYDALTSDRPYRKAMLPSDAIEYIMGGYNTMFDPVIVDALTKKVAPYPIGTCLELSTGQVGIVVKNYEETSLRPLVKLIVDNKPTNRYVDLSNDRKSLNITIKGIINLD